MIDTIRLYVFLVVVYLSILFGIFWIILYLRKRRFIYENIKGKHVPITIIVPAYNEEKYIEKCIKSIENQDCDNKIDIITVDDGSIDNTLKLSKNLAKKYKNIKIIHQKNMGKSSAINNALKYVKTDVFGYIDADSYMSKNIISKSIEYISKYDSVVAPAIPSKTNKLILKLQELEYMTVAISRRLSSLIGAMFLTPGFAIYKTSVIRKIHGFCETTITEDLEMGLKLIMNGYKIGYIPNTFVFTECPDAWKKFFEQRIRWTRGFIQNMIKYKKMIFNKKYEHLGIFMLPMRTIIPVLVVLLYILSTYDTILNVVKSTIDLINTNFDFNYFLSSQHISFSTYNIVFFLLLTTSMITLIEIARKYTKRKISIKYLLIFILIYPSINMLIIIISVIEEIVGVKKRW